MTRSETDKGGNQEIVMAWQKGEPTRIARSRAPQTSVLSLRVPSDLMKALGEQARNQGKSASQLARELIETALLDQTPQTPARIAKLFSRWADEFNAAQGRKKSAH